MLIDSVYQPEQRQTRGSSRKAKHTMTDTDSTTPEVEAPESQPAIPSLLDIVKSLVIDNRAKANAIVQNVLKNRVNVGKVVHELRNAEDTEDETIKAFQAWKELATAAINEKTAEIDTYIKSNLVQTSEMTEEEFEAEKAKYTLLKKAQADALKLAKSQPGFSEEAFADIPSLLSLSTGKEAGASASVTGIRRPRLISLTVNGEDMGTEKAEKDGTVSMNYTFSGAATWITKDSGVKVTASDLSGAAFTEVGSDNLSDATSVEYTFTVTDKEGVVHSYDLVAIPENREEAASETETVEEVTPEA
jgi:hypothetical protein